MSRRAELEALVAELAGDGPRHIAWRFLAAGTALLEALADARPSLLDQNVYATYLSANGSPRSDTFLARDLARDPAHDRAHHDRTLAERSARAVLRARAALAAIRKLDGQLPEQPLWRALQPQGGWLRRVELDPARDVAAFVTPHGVFVAPLDDARSLVRALAEAAAGRPPSGPLEAVNVANRGPVPAAVAVDLSPQPGSTARHLHRRAWSTGGGPWLGLGETRDLEIVTTCHLAVDGFGHTRLATETFAALDRVEAAEWQALVGSASEAVGAAEVELSEAAPVIGALPLGFAGRVVAGDNLRFAPLAYAFARTLDILHRRTPGSTRLAPTLQVTLAPGERDDPERRRRRVRFALMPARGTPEAPESFASFSARLRELVAKENERPGLLTRVLTATATAPLPRWVRRRLLSSEGLPSASRPPVEVLGGRGSLSFMRFDAEERPAPPLYGLSSPGLAATDEDPFGSMVATIIHHGSSVTISIGGTGVAGDAMGASEVVDLFVEELERIAPG